jgi:hypothetical protein
VVVVAALTVEMGVTATATAPMPKFFTKEELAKPLKASVISSRNGQKRKTCSKMIELNRLKTNKYH